MRVRREDRGQIAVIVDKDNEDDRIQEELSNETYYTETDHDPKEEFINQIKEWADDALENEERNEKQHHFDTNIDSTNLAKINPLYKTHKKDENGLMVNPFPTGPSLLAAALLSTVSANCVKWRLNI